MTKRTYKLVETKSFFNIKECFDGDEWHFTKYEKGKWTKEEVEKIVEILNGKEIHENNWKTRQTTEIEETETHWIFIIKREYCMASTETGEMITAYWTGEVGRLQKDYCPKELAEDLAKRLYRKEQE